MDRKEQMKIWKEKEHKQLTMKMEKQKVSAITKTEN